MNSTPPNSVEDWGSSTWSHAYLDQVGTTIRLSGWAIQGVFPPGDVPLESQLQYAYSIGLLTRGCSAELLVAGLPLQLSAQIINEIAASMLNSGEQIPPHDWNLSRSYLLKGVVQLPRPNSIFDLSVAKAYYQILAVPVVQYVWPDKRGNYPWDPGWDSDLTQPLGGNRSES